MRITIAILGLVLGLMAVSDTAGAAGANSSTSCRCPGPETGWAVHPDSATWAPAFLFQPYVKVSRLLVCEHGVYFFFRAKVREDARSVCLAYPVPTKELYARSGMEEDSLSVGSLTRELTSPARKALYNYQEFVTELRGLLGGDYREGRIIHFDRARVRRPKLYFANPLAIELHNETVEFQPLMDIYYKNVH